MAELKPCGSAAAYRRHKRRGEEVCDACQRAHAEAWVQWRRNPPAPREIKPCGTEAAYQRHIRRRKKLREAGDLVGARAENPCFLCRVAHSNYMLEYVRAHRARRRAVA